MLRSSVLLALALLWSAPATFAQSTIASGTLVTFGSQAHANIVQDGFGRLYALHIEEQPNTDRALLLRVSFDGGITWQAIPGALNDATSGLTQPNATNNCALAIDDRGVLHLTWASQYYPSYYTQYYASYDPVAASRSAIVDIAAQAGASLTSRNAAMDIAVDASNTIWMVSASGSLWVEQLLYSTQPYAVGGTFASAGPISPSASSQTSRMVIDAQGLVHCSYYRNVAPGIYEHRAYDPGTASWGIETMIGNATAPNDYYGVLSADALGNVHSVYAKDTAGSADWDFAYRRWDAVGGWGNEVPLFRFTSAEYTGIANYRIVDLACDENTGRVTVLYRDLAAGGRLSAIGKDLAAAQFEHVADLRPATTGLHAYYELNLRGSLFPASNRTGGTVDFSWREGSSPYTLYFQRIPTCSGASVVRTGEGCPDGSGEPLVSVFGGAPCLQGVFEVGVRGSAPAWLTIGVTDTQWNGIPLPLDLSLFGAGAGCALRCSQDVLAGPLPQGVLASFPVPNLLPLVGRSVWFQSILLDGAIGTTLPIATSDALRVTFGR